MEFVRTHQYGIPSGRRISVREEGWTTPSPGLRIRGDVALTHELLTDAAIRVSTRTAVACDLTAAHLWSLVVPSGFGLDVDAQACALATVRDGSRHRASGIRGRRLTMPPNHVTELDGIPITTPARTWLDCAQLVSWRDVVAMGDAMLRSGLANKDQLGAVVRWGAGRRGVRFAREALAILDARAESPGESWVRALLMRADLPRPTCNVTVEVFGWSFRLDIAWRDLRCAVEYDGEEYHGPERRAHDLWRRELLRRAGWTILVVTKKDLRDGDALVRMVRAALAKAGGQRVDLSRRD